MDKKEARPSFVFKTVLALSLCSLMISFPLVTQAQAIDSQRDKPATNGNPDNPKMNPSLAPNSPSTMGDPNNPLLKKNKRGSTDVGPLKKSVNRSDSGSGK